MRKEDILFFLVSVIVMTFLFKIVCCCCLVVTLFFSFTKILLSTLRTFTWTTATASLRLKMTFIVVISRVVFADVFTLLPPPFFELEVFCAIPISFTKSAFRAFQFQWDCWHPYFMVFIKNEFSMQFFSMFYVYFLPFIFSAVLFYQARLFGQKFCRVQKTPNPTLTRRLPFPSGSRACCRMHSSRKRAPIAA